MRCIRVSCAIAFVALLCACDSSPGRVNPPPGLSTDNHAGSFANTMSATVIFPQQYRLVDLGANMHPSALDFKDGAMPLNGKGAIVGTGSYNGAPHGFLLIPKKT